MLLIQFLFFREATSDVLLPHCISQLIQRLHLLTHHPQMLLPTTVSGISYQLPLCCSLSSIKCMRNCIFYRSDMRCPS